jgi:hypothetical protein
VDHYYCIKLKCPRGPYFFVTCLNLGHLSSYNFEYLYGNTPEIWILKIIPSCYTFSMELFETSFGIFVKFSSYWAYLHGENINFNEIYLASPIGTVNRLLGSKFLNCSRSAREARIFVTHMSSRPNTYVLNFSTGNTRVHTKFSTTRVSLIYPHRIPCMY